MVLANTKWQPIFRGKRALKTLAKCLYRISPPAFIERLPRDLERNYSHGVPCLIGILPDIYLQHFAKLSEATYNLLGYCITAQALGANTLLDEFYSEFEALYGGGSRGLNVHNAGWCFRKPGFSLPATKASNEPDDEDDILLGQLIHKQKF